MIGVVVTQAKVMRIEIFRFLVEFFPVTNTVYTTLMSVPALSRVSTNIHVELYLPYDEEEGIPEKVLDATVNNNEFLMKENQLFASFVHRHSAQVSAALEEEEEYLSTLRNRQEREYQRSKNSVLTMEQKLEVASRELEDTKEDVESVEQQGAIIISKINALLSEAALSASDERKLLFSFKKDVLQTKDDDLNPNRVEICGDKLISFYQQKIKERNTTVEKLKLKNTGLRQKINTVRKRLQTKEISGEGLREIDFEQLKIENRQYMHRLDEYNEDLMNLKVVAGKVVSDYNDFKDLLNDALLQTTLLTKELASRREALQRLASEIAVVVKDRDSVDHTSQVLKVRTFKGSGPSTADYIEQKRQEEALVKEVKNWERKIEIARITAKNRS
ncbi:hypothetical protein GEMRC1_007790 [Eukaryota sp. GEM-RC1]